MRAAIVSLRIFTERTVSFNKVSVIAAAVVA